MMIRFDDALGEAIRLVRASTRGDESLTLVRDVAGQLTAVLDDGALPAGDWAVLARALDETLGAFSPGPKRVLLRKSDLLDEQDVVDSPDRTPVADAECTWIVDRLLSNQDWLREPRLTESTVPLAVAFSLKGGVGRSTALAVLAWHLGRMGKSVVAVDLDLEAPGLGSLLLDELPDYGLVDWLVEALVGQADPLLLQDCLASSPVAGGSPGVVQVLPAFGRRTKNYVAKIGRIFLPGLGPDGFEVGLAERLETLVSALVGREERPDVILLDARAGLHDIGAAAVTQLGGEVFLFARDEPQSWRAYQLLFQHLARSKGLEFGMPDNDLRWRMKMVAAQIERTEGAVASWVDGSYDAWLALYDEEQKDEEQTSRLAERPAQTFARDDDAAPHYPLQVYFDGGLRGALLGDNSRRPTWPAVEAAFGNFLAGATSRLLPEDGPLGGRVEGAD